MKKLIILFMFLTLNLFSVEYIIDDKKITFNVPDKYDKLKEYYLAVIDAYVTVLRNSMKVSKELDEITNKNKQLLQNIDDLEILIKNNQNNIRDLENEILKLKAQLKEKKPDLLQIYSTPSFKINYNLSLDGRNTFDVVAMYNMSFNFFEKYGLFAGVGVGTRIPQYSLYVGNIVFDANLGINIRIK